MDRPNLAHVAVAAIATAFLAGACSPAPSATAPPVLASGPPPASGPPGTSAPSPSAAAVASPGPGASGGTAAIDPANFTTTIDNQWLSLKPGTTFTYEGTEDGEKLLETFQVTSETKVVDGVTCVVIHDNLK